MATPTLAQLLDLNEVVQILEVKHKRSERVSNVKRLTYEVLYRGNQFDVDGNYLGVFGQNLPQFDTATGAAAWWRRA